MKSPAHRAAQRGQDALLLPQRPLPLLLACALASLAGNAGADEDINLAKVVVSASKIEQATSEAPSNVTVITSDLIQESAGSRLGDALVAQVPSLYLKENSVGGSSRTAGTGIIALRGAYGARTKVLLNGVTSLADANSANLNLNAVTTGDVERIEIVPGVSSSLYGSDAIGGVVNIITKAPSKREFDLRAGHGYGDGNRDTLQAAYRDKFANGIGLSLSAMHEERNGFNRNDFITTTTTACGVCTTVVNGWEKTTDTAGNTRYIIGDRGAIPSTTDNYSGSLYYDLTPTDKLKASTTHYKTTQGYSRYNLYLNTALPATNLSLDGRRVASLAETSTWMPGASAKTEDFYTLGYEGKLAGDFLLKLDASYADRNYWYLSPNAGATYTSGAGTRTQTPNNTLDLAAQLNFPLGQDHFIVAGVALNRSNLNRAVYSLSNWRDGENKTALTDQGDGRSETSSFFLQDQISIGRALTLYAGARYDDWKSSGYVAKVGSPTPSKDIPSHGEGALSPRLAAVYKLTDSVALKASAGTAFRAPTLYDMYAADTVSAPKLIVADPGLKPERAKAVDFGTEINLPNGANFKAAYFFTRITDMIYSKETPYTGPYTATIPATVTILSQKTNAAEGTTKGIELSGDLPLTSWLTAAASYTWTDARITKDNSGTGMLDKYLTYVPKNMASLALRGKYHDWSGSLSTRYSGLSYTSALNSDQIKEIYSGTSRYWLTDLRVNYQIDKHFKASVMVNNLLNEKYYEYYLMPGRSVAVELSARF